MKLVIKIVLYAVVIYLITNFFPGMHVQDVANFLLLAVVLIALRTVLKPILTLLTLPIGILTLGLFSLVINTVILLIADALLPGVTIDNLLIAFVVSFFISFGFGIADIVIKK